MALQQRCVPQLAQAIRGPPGPTAFERTMSIFHRWLLKRQSRSVRRHFSLVMRPTRTHLSSSTTTR